MIYILLLFLIVGAFLAYLLNGRNILSAWLLSYFMYILSVIVVILSMDYFETDISAKTAIVIFAALFFWGCGELTAKAIYSGRLISINGKPMYKRNAVPIFISRKMIFAICVFMFLVFIFRFRDIYIMSLHAGNPGDIFKTIQYARFYMSQMPEAYSMGIILSQGSVLSECLTYFLTFVYFYNNYFHGLKNRLLLLPIPIYMLQLMCSTGRTGYIEMITVILVLSFVLLKGKTNWSRRYDGKMIRTGIIAIISFLVLFRLFGYLTETSLRNELWNNFSEYIGASIIGLDQYLQSAHSDNILFGQETMRNIYMILRDLGFNIPWYSPHHTFFYWANGDSNVYTGLRKSIQDYTIVGMFIIKYMLGFLYAFMIEQIKNKKATEKSAITYILCGMLFYPIVMTAIADVYSTIITTEMLYKIFYLLIINWFFVSRKKSKQVKLKLKLEPSMR